MEENKKRIIDNRWRVNLSEGSRLPVIGRGKKEKVDLRQYVELVKKINIKYLVMVGVVIFMVGVHLINRISLNSRRNELREKLSNYEYVDGERVYLEKEYESIEGVLRRIAMLNQGGVVFFDVMKRVEEQLPDVVDLEKVFYKNHLVLKEYIPNNVSWEGMVWLKGRVSMEEREGVEMLRQLEGAFNKKGNKDIRMRVDIDSVQFDKIEEVVKFEITSNIEKS